MNRIGLPKIAVVGSEYHRSSHCDVIVSRWLEPRPTDSLYGWGPPRTQIASMFVDQIHPDRDFAVEKCAKFGIPLHSTIHDALTLGGTDLAVDAVLLICEHGDYPVNEFQQKLYPRKEFFDQVMEVFSHSGRNVPLFFDKHLSWNPDWIQEMFARIQNECVPFFAGSSLPFQPVTPEIRIPEGGKIREVVAIYHNALEDYLFHSLEFVQSVIEKREGGETGVVKIVAWKDEVAWDAMDRGAFSASLLDTAARAVSDEAQRAMRDFTTLRDKPISVFQLTYADGLIVTHFMQRDTVRKWALACEMGDGAIHLGSPQTAGEDHFFPHFARFCRRIEDFFLTAEVPSPRSRIYQTSLATALCMRALARPGTPLPTPELRPPNGSGSDR